MRDVMGSLVSMAICSGVTLMGCSASSDDTKTPEGPPPNPAALPCPTLNSGYAGDDLCILPPDPALGIQLHVGPTNYADPAEVAPYLLGPGDEKTLCYYFHAQNTETVNFFEQHYRMRPGSHHLIMYMGSGTTTHADGWGACESTGYIPIGGTQRSVSEFPPNGIVAPEDSNLYRPLTPNVQMKFELHFVNTTDKAILREVWVNLIRKETTPESQILGGVFMIGGLRLSVAPGNTYIANYSCPLGDTVDRRVVSLFGHRHAHTKRFSVWAHHAGSRDLIYEDYDWSEPAELTYNTVEQNPQPDRTANLGGGSTGLQTFAPGDQIEWECEIDNTTDPLTGDPSTITLGWGNEVYTGEMCNLFGSSVGETTFWSCTPERQTAP
jgi:hypothetical protein